MVDQILTRAIDVVQGDQWSFTGAFLNPDGTAMDGAGSDIVAAIVWYGGRLDIETVLASESDDRTGILWTDRGAFEFTIKVNEADTAEIPIGFNTQLFWRQIDSYGDRFTRCQAALTVRAE